MIIYLTIIGAFLKCLKLISFMDSPFDTFLDEIDPDINYFESQISQNQVFSAYNSIDELKLNNPSFLNDQIFYPYSTKI